MEAFVFYTGCFLILLSAVAAIVLRRYLVRYTASLIACLDQMIDGKKEIVFEEENELLMSKVQVKLRQLYEILGSRTQQSMRDRENLEGIITDISHQVKTPIANIRMYHSILQRRSLPPQREKEFMELLDSQVGKLDSLMESMIAMSRMEVGIIRVEPVYQRLMPLMEQVIAQAALKAEQKGIEIEFNCQEGLKAVFDMKWTQEALGNILDNGVKYTKNKGIIKISAMKTDFFVRIMVADNGKGIPEDLYTEIFKRFYREEEVRQQEGIGVGLFLAQEITRKQKGYIDVKSEVGKGSVFSLYLPAEE